MSEKGEGKHSHKVFLKRAKQAGMHEFEPHEAAPDGQLLYHIDGDEEKALFDELLERLPIEREKRAAEAQEFFSSSSKKAKQKHKELHANFSEEVTASPLYLKDDSAIGRFWLMSCMRARKYEIDRALDLYFNYLRFRVEHGIGDPDDHEEALTQKCISDDIMRVCGNVDMCGRYIWGFDGGSFNPAAYSPRAVGRAVHHLIDQLYRRHPEAAVRGIVFISNMKGYGYHNFDPETEKVFMRGMTNHMPVRIGSFNLLHLPIVLKMVLSVLKMFMKKKMRERMVVSSEQKLLAFIDADQLDIEYGGRFLRNDNHLQYPCELPFPDV